MLLGLYVLAVEIHGLVRYDPAYFTSEYTSRYDTPGAVARALESALQTGDGALLAELQGRRNAAKFHMSPNMMFVMLWEYTDRYYTYLYFDTDTYRRYAYHVEEMQERYVITHPDAYYYLHSGRWLVVFLPVALTWWSVETVVVLGVWIHRLSARARQKMYGV
jgi:hypothetical protein